MYRQLRAALVCALAMLGGCGDGSQDGSSRAPSPRASVQPAAPAGTEAAEAALGLTRRLPADYVKACLEILREMHVNPCPPLVPDGPMEIQASGDSLDVISSVLSSIDGREIDAHRGHWTIWVANHKRGQRLLADHMHATGARAPSQCRFVQVEGQRVEACRVPPYPDGGYYGNHIAYEWHRGDAAINVTIHNHANEPRLRLMMAALIVQNTPPPVRPQFKTARITRCADDQRHLAADRPAAAASDVANMSSGTMTLGCQTVASLAAIAYVQYEDGLGHPRWAIGESGTVVIGGPLWIQSDEYAVEATADGPSSTPAMAGPMLQTLLEDRFKLQVHYETRDVPVYELTRADDWHQKLQRVAAAGRCVSPDTARNDFGRPALAAGERWCAREISSTSTVSRLNVEGSTIAELATFLSAQSLMGRRVSDRTGYPGQYDFLLEFAHRPDGQPISRADARRSFFTALDERFGLRLQPATGSGRFLVVDRVERPAGD